MTEMNVETLARLSSKPKKRSISLRGVEEEYHMMIVWDKMKPKLEERATFISAYELMEKELLQLLAQNDHTINFTPLYLGPNSTYGEVDPWLTSFVHKYRDTYPWINVEKDLPMLVDKQSSSRPLFAHTSRRELKEGSSMLSALNNLVPVKIKVCLEK
jgi:hypothetical protein